MGSTVWSHHLMLFMVIFCSLCCLDILHLFPFNSHTFDVPSAATNLYDFYCLAHVCCVLFCACISICLMRIGAIECDYAITCPHNSTQQAACSQKPAAEYALLGLFAGFSVLVEFCCCCCLYFIVVIFAIEWKELLFLQQISTSDSMVVLGRSQGVHKIS